VYGAAMEPMRESGGWGVGGVWAETLL